MTSWPEVAWITELEILEMERKRFWLFLLLKLFMPSSVSGTYDPNCEEIETFKDEYFSDLEIVQDLHMKNNRLSAKINFKYPSYIKSWNIRGRAGDTSGPMIKRAGLILKYTVKYGNKDGTLVPVETPSTHRTGFINKGNLATPDYVTNVKLEHPIKTKELRFYPQMWDGSPYIAIRVQFCMDPEDKTTWADVKEENTAKLSTDYFERLKKMAKKEHPMTVDEMKAEDRAMAKRVREKLEESKDVDEEDDEVDEDEEEDDEEGEEEDVDDEDEEKDEILTKTATKPKTARDFAKKEKKKKGEVSCETSVQWRYTGKTEIRDAFTSVSGSTTAYRLAFSSLDHPYLFPENSKQEYVQVKFAAPSRVYAIRTVGKGETGDWGGILQFSLFYRDIDDGKWKYYTDDNNDRRIFDTKGRGRTAVSVPEEFDLPRPFDTALIRLYPHKWTAKPYLCIDLKACYLREPYPRFDDCKKSLLSQDESLVSIGFDDLHSDDDLTNYKVYRTLDLEDIEDSALVTGIRVRVSHHDSAPNLIKSFVMQYFNQDQEWKNVIDDDGIIKVFNVIAKDSGAKIIKLPEPVETGFLRLYPESWNGANPKVYIDVLGCTDF